MFIPEPLLSLVVAYHTDGNPVPRILCHSRPARVGEERDWAAVRRLMDLKAHELLKGARGETIYKQRFMKVVTWVDETEEAFAKAVMLARVSKKPPLVQPPILGYHEQRYYSLTWHDEGGLRVTCSFEEAMPYTVKPAHVIFVCKGRMLHDDHARRLHNGVNVFVI